MGTKPACSLRAAAAAKMKPRASRSEEHTSELQSRLHLVCRLLLEKKKLIVAVALVSDSGAAQESTRVMADVGLLTLDPGHFHAALVQKEMSPGASPRVDVFAPLWF